MDTAAVERARRSLVRTAVNPLALLKMCDCSVCGCAKDGYANRPVYGYGPLNATIVVVGEAPGVFEIEKGEPFVGQSGGLIQRVLKRAGVKWEGVYRTNALLCVAPKSPSAKSLAACNARLRAELAALTEKRVILALGAKAADALRGTHEPMARLNGQIEWSDEYGAFIAYAWHPAYILRMPNTHDDFAWAVGRAVKVAKTGVLPVKEEKLGYALARPDTSFVLRDAMRRDVIVCDLETTGLDPREDSILEIGLRWESAIPLIIPREVALAAPWYGALKELFANRAITFVGHNYKFDVEFLRVAGFDARVGADTMLMHYCLDERSGGEGGGFHDLKTLAKRYLDAAEWESEVERLRKEGGGSFASIPAAIRQKYQAYDLEYTWRLYPLFRDLLAKEPHSRSGFLEPRQVHEKLLVPAANAIAAIELRGVRVDTARLPEFEERYRRDAEEVRAKLREMVGAPVDFNPGSTVQVAKYVYGAPYNYASVKGRSTDVRTLEQLIRNDEAEGKEANPFLEGITAYRSFQHTRSLYLAALRERTGTDGRIRTNLLLHGTVTGRLASRSPNLQNLPADSAVKELFIPSDGHVMFNADYKQLEVRCLAFYSRDPALIASLRATDYHWEVAKAAFPDIVAALEAAKGSIPALERVLRMTTMLAEFARRQSRPAERTDDPDVLFGWIRTKLRKKSKAVTFGKMYGEGAAALASPGRGLGCEVWEAEAFMGAWDIRYPYAVDFLDSQSNLAKRTGWVEGYTGRRRRFNIDSGLKGSWATEGCNAPIQSFASDINLIALTRLNTRLPEEGLGDVLMPVHDSILGELEEGKVERGLAVVREVMTGVVPDDEVLFDIDVATGASWGACH